MRSIRGGTSCRTPCTRTSTPRNENVHIGATRSIPLIMHADKAARSNSAGLSASRRPASAVSSVSVASLHVARLPDASTRRAVTENSNLAVTLGGRDSDMPKPSAGLPGLSDRLVTDPELTRAHRLALDVVVSAGRGGGTDSGELTGDGLRHATAHTAHGARQLRAR